MSVFALIDCNNFFASCERVFRPELATRPVVVLSNNDGCIVARSSQARALGVPMGVPYFMVRDLLKANNAAVFSANFGLYGNMSQRITSILTARAPNIEVYSVDESFVELTNLASVVSLQGASLENELEQWALEVRAEVLAATGVPVSIGIAPTKTLAKAAAEYTKKQGSGTVHVAMSEKARESLLDWLPIGDVWGVGRRNAPKLLDVGISTAVQFTQVSDAWIQQKLGLKGLATVRELRGQVEIPLGNTHAPQKSIMRSRGFGHTVRAYYELESAVATFTASAAAKLRTQGSVCSAMAVYMRIKQAGSKRGAGISRLVTLPEATDNTGQLITVAMSGLDDIYDGEASYLKAGVYLLGLTSRESWQLSLTNPDVQRDRHSQLMGVLDGLNARFGKGTVWYAVQSPKKSTWQSKKQWRSPAYTTSWRDIPIAGI